MLNKKLVIIFIIILTIVIPIGLWLMIPKGENLPPITKIDKVSGPEAKYDETRSAHKEYLINQNYLLGSDDQKIVDKLKQQSNPLYQSQNITVEYDPEEDLFISEVKTIRIEPAKREGVNWFRIQGLSLEAICILPVTFIINEESADALRGFDLQFDPLATDCP